MVVGGGFAFSLKWSSPLRGFVLWIRMGYSFLGFFKLEGTLSLRKVVCVEDFSILQNILFEIGKIIFMVRGWYYFYSEILWYKGGG